MKDQSQEPTAPTTYYPAWQTESTHHHHQGWANQFMQPGGSMDFTMPQPQPYPYPPTNGSAQNGLLFDPNYRAPTTPSSDSIVNNPRNSPNSNPSGSFEPNSHPPTSINGSEWDWTGGVGEKLYPKTKPLPEDHRLAGEYNSAYYSQSQHTSQVKKESTSPHNASEGALSKSSHKENGGAFLDGRSTAPSSHERTSSSGFLAAPNESQKYHPTFNHQSYFNMYYPNPSTYGALEHTSPAGASKFHSVLPPTATAAAPNQDPPSSAATYPHHHQHQAHYDQQQDAASFKVDPGKDKKLFHHHDEGGSATSANSLLVANESGGDHESKNSSGNSATYDKARKESKLYQPQLNLNSTGNGDDHHQQQQSHMEGPTKDGGVNGGESGKGESYGTTPKSRVQHHSNQLLSSMSMVIKEEPLDGYCHPQQQQQHQQPQHHHHSMITQHHHRDYQQSKLYHPQNGYYSYATGATDPDNQNHHHRYYNPEPQQQQQQQPHHLTHSTNPKVAMGQVEMEKRLNEYDMVNGGAGIIDDGPTSNPVICQTNFEKEIPGYHITGRLNGVHTEDTNSYGKLANGIKVEPVAQDYQSTEQYYEGGVVEEEKKSEAIENPSDKHPSPPETPVDRTEKSQKPEVPDCDCFSSEKTSPEPGSYYTHLGCAATLTDLRTQFETRFNIQGRQLRIEKVLYTGKEGKTGQGCPLAKWIIRRTDQEEKVLCIVKKRQGHRCAATFLIICIVVWDGIPKHEADDVYKLLIHKLNKFGLPTTRRCATNENRTCACQGLDPETSGASFSFGCSWSMYYNGCKYARSKTVRKFRLSVKSEEAEIEERMNYLATMLAPLYERATPKAYENQCKYEHEAPDCRLGFHNGKPFSGVTACMDFCAHAHRDLHNMQDGCTVQVALLRNRHPSEEVDEQLHILPLYVMDTTDELGSEDGQKEKNNTGGVQTLDKFPCEVRIRSTPLQPCRRHGKKRPGKEGEEETSTPTTPSTTPAASKKESKSSKSGSKSSAAKNQDSNSGQSTTSKSPGASQSPRAQTPSTTAAATAAQATQHNNSNSSAFVPPNGQFAAADGAGAVGATGGGNVGVGGVAGSGGGNANGGGQLNPNSNLVNMASMIDHFTEAQLQSNQISSTVLDSPYTYDYNTGSYVDSRHNYYNHPAAAAAAAVHHTHPHSVVQQPPPASHHGQWPDYNNNQSQNASASVFDSSTPNVGDGSVQQQLSSKLHRGIGGLEENPDSTSVPNSQQYNGFAGGGGAGADPTKVSHADVDYFKPKHTEYPAATNQSSYSMYPPPPHHHHHHHHPGFPDPQTYQQNYDYRYNYSPYANQAFHHPYSGMYSPSAYTSAHGWNTMYSAAAAAATPPSNHTVVPHSSPHIPVSVGGGGSPFGHPSGGGYGNQLLPLSTPVTPAPVIKVEVTPKVEPIGEVQEARNDNLEAFQDAQMGGIGIALGHGSVLFECAKHEMHATTALKVPNRTHPNRIALIFYQHRNLNRPKHGTIEWEEKMRQKKNSQEVENRLLKSIKQEEGAGEEGHREPPAGTTTTTTSKKSKGNNKPEKSSSTNSSAAATEIKSEVIAGPSVASVSLLHSQSISLPPVAPSPVLPPVPVAPSWPGNFSVGYPIPASPYHQHPHAHHHPHAHPHAHHHHHHMMGPIPKSSHIGSPTRSSLST